MMRRKVTTVINSQYVTTYYTEVGQNLLISGGVGGENVLAWVNLGH